MRFDDAMLKRRGGLVLFCGQGTPVYMYAAPLRLRQTGSGSAAAVHCDRRLMNRSINKHSRRVTVMN